MHQFSQQERVNAPKRYFFLFLLGLGLIFCFSGSLPKGQITIAATVTNFRDSTISLVDETGKFFLPPLPYDYEDLAPYIDPQTLQIHHDKHHAGYVDKLKGAIAQSPQLQGKSLEELLTNLDSLPNDIRSTVRNSGGGHLNHSIFWSIMTPYQSEPEGDLARAIEKSFGSISDFQQQFEDAGQSLFGSGWVWLVSDNGGNLEIVTTPNQDNPIENGLFPIIGNDLWEHAYYLGYQNRRGDYLRDWWHVVDWQRANTRYQLALKARPSPDSVVKS